MLDSLSPFHEDYLSAEHLHTYAQQTTNISSRIDYHWLSPSLTAQLFFSSVYWPDYRIMNSDHAIVHSILLTENLFDGKATAKLKQQDVGRKVIDYKSITKDNWDDFASVVDTSIKTEITGFSSVILQNKDDLSSLWTHLSNIIMCAAGSKLPHKKIYSQKRRPLPEQLSQLSDHWLLINRCFRLTAKPRITRSPPRYPDIDAIISLNDQIADMAKTYKSSLPELPLSLDLAGIKNFRRVLRTVKLQVQALLQQE